MTLASPSRAIRHTSDAARDAAARARPPPTKCDGRSTRANVLALHATTKARLLDRRGELDRAQRALNAYLSVRSSSPNEPVARHPSAHLVVKLADLRREYDENLEHRYACCVGRIVDQHCESLRAPVHRDCGDAERVRIEAMYVDAASKAFGMFDFDVDFASASIAAYDHAGRKLPQSTPSSASSASSSSTGDRSRFECEACGNVDREKFDIDDAENRRVCLSCSTVVRFMETGCTHEDYNRANVVSKFSYNRIVHFQDCIKQFQGKQNCKIPDKLYADLDAKFKAYRLLVDGDGLGDSRDGEASFSTSWRAIRYSKITPEHITLFLKELKYTKHYENVNVIYYALTNKRAVDISHLEHKLVDDFREFVALYDRYHSKDKPDSLDRKNFINCQYLLFQLLRRHGYQCRIENFSVLKTTERKLFHDRVCSRLFNELHWNFTKTF